MRLPRVHFTIKRMMLATAVLAFAMGCCKIAWLASRYRRAAEHFAELERLCRRVQQLAQENEKNLDDLALFSGSGPFVGNTTARAAAAKGFERTINFYAALRRKYERAAARPWLAVEPDAERPEP